MKRLVQILGIITCLVWGVNNNSWSYSFSELEGIPVEYVFPSSASQAQKDNFISNNTVTITVGAALTPPSGSGYNQMRQLEVTYSHSNAPLQNDLTYTFDYWSIRDPYNRIHHYSDTRRRSIWYLDYLLNSSESSLTNTRPTIVVYLKAANTVTVSGVSDCATMNVNLQGSSCTLKEGQQSMIITSHTTDSIRSWYVNDTLVPTELPCDIGKTTIILQNNGSTNSSLVLILPGYNVRVRASCTVPTYTLTLLTTPTGSGSVSGGGSYTAGSTHTITATPASGYRFVNWSDGNTNASRSYTMPAANTTLTAAFERVYTITLRSNPTNSGNVSGGGTYSYGSQVTISTSPR